MAHKCEFPNGTKAVQIGNVKLDPCQYVVAEAYRNVTVEVLRCRVCGAVSIGWRRQENTEAIIMEE